MKEKKFNSAVSPNLNSAVSNETCTSICSNPNSVCSTSNNSADIHEITKAVIDELRKNPWDPYEFALAAQINGPTITVTQLRKK